MAISTNETADLVRKSGLVTEKDLLEAIATSSHLQIPLHDVLIGRGLINKEKLGEMMAAAMGVGYVNVRRTQIPPEVLEKINEKVALERKVMPFALEGHVLSVAMVDPKDLETIEFIRKVSGLEVRPFWSFEKDVKFALRLFRGTLKEEFRELLAKVQKGRLEQASLAELAADVSIVEAVDKLLEFAVVEGASDIHIEGLPDRTLIRYRIDGILHDVLELPKEIHSAIIARVKILAGLKLDETRLPQDGRMRFESEEGERINLRVSILPAIEGEKVVLRLLESGEQQLSLESLGVDTKRAEVIKEVLFRPHGLILVTGPTGSGKSTTLYTMLGILNTSEVNVSTVEDPVENRIRRINQMQVNPRINLGFADGLRALLRQDPDVIMVGEIRDGETAKMAVNAAMTGHMVVSTLHTNDAPGAIPRLIDLGAEPFLIASTLELVIAQRLIRENCEYCRVKTPVEEKWLKYLLSIMPTDLEKENLRQVMPKEMMAGKGCTQCNFTGYRGRKGVYEMFPIDEEVRELILRRATASEIRELALKKGMKTMLLDGLERVAAGKTSLEEVLRVTFS